MVGITRDKVLQAIEDLRKIKKSCALVFMLHSLRCIKLGGAQPLLVLLLQTFNVCNLKESTYLDPSTVT